MSSDSISSSSLARTIVPLASPGTDGDSPPQGDAVAALSEQKTVISKRRPDVSPEAERPTRPSDVARLLEGETLGHFLLEEYIGGGGMGVVFRGLDQSLGRTVAVKVLSTETTDEETRRRFRNEAQSAARLDHPNIARVYFVDEDKGWNYIVFEYIEGENVRDLVQRSGPLRLEQAVSYVLQVADALAHASERDVVHRDIKPSNILVMPDGRAKLVDMGLARLHQVASASNDLTASGVTLGTFDYISPEQARDPRLADVRSDLYSLGCTFYFMLTGVPPFPEGTVLQKLLSHTSDPPPDPRERSPDLPAEVSALVLRLMAKQPIQRFQHPAELVGALLLMAEQLGLPAMQRSGAAWISRQETWITRLEAHLPWLVPVALLVAIVFGIEWLHAPQPITRAQMQPKGTLPARTQEDLAAVNSAVARDALPAGDSATTEKAVPQANPPSEKAPTPAGDSIPGSGPEPAKNGDAGPPPAQPNAADTPIPSPGSASQVKPPPRNGEQAGDSIPQVSSQVPASDRGDLAESPGSGGTALDTASSPDPPAAAIASHVIVVNPSRSLPRGPQVVDSLQEAFRRATDSLDVTTIELQFNECEQSPLTLSLPEGRDALTVKSAQGYRPVLAFRPSASYIAADRRMLNLIGGRVFFAGVHFRVELPYDMAEGWSLFYLNQVSEVRLTDCTLTIRNPFFCPASFFTVQGERPGGSDSPMAALMDLRKPKITIASTIARGQATLVRALEGLPFWLDWDQGFFATTEHLVEASGLAEAAPDKVLRITLSNVTANMDRGLFRLKLDDQSAFVPEVGIRCDNCVLVHDSSAPLVEYVGAETLEKATGSLEIEGRDSFYDSTSIRWRISPARGAPVDFRWEDQDQPWYKERRAERWPRWLRPPRREGDMSERIPQDYLLEASVSRLAGFDLSRLPALPQPGDTNLEPVRGFGGTTLRAEPER